MDIYSIFLYLNFMYELCNSGQSMHTFRGHIILTSSPNFLLGVENRSHDKLVPLVLFVVCIAEWMRCHTPTNKHTHTYT